MLEAEGLKPFGFIGHDANARMDASRRCDGHSVHPITGSYICCDSIVELIDVSLEIPESPDRVVPV